MRYIEIDTAAFYSGKLTYFYLFTWYHSCIDEQRKFCHIFIKDAITLRCSDPHSTGRYHDRCFCLCIDWRCCKSCCLLDALLFAFSDWIFGISALFHFKFWRILCDCFILQMCHWTLNYWYQVCAGIEPLKKCASFTKKAVDVNAWSIMQRGTTKYFNS